MLIMQHKLLFNSACPCLRECNKIYKTNKTYYETLFFILRYWQQLLFLIKHGDWAKSNAGNILRNLFSMQNIHFALIPYCWNSNKAIKEKCFAENSFHAILLLKISFGKYTNKLLNWNIWRENIFLCVFSSNFENQYTIIKIKDLLYLWQLH